MPATPITRAENVRLTTVENVRSDLTLSEAAAPTQKVERWIDQATGMVQSFCNRVFARQTYRERVVAQPFAAEILLSEGPVIRILSITNRGTPLADGFDYELDGGLIYALRNGARCAWHSFPMVVEYEAGWDLPGEPAGTPAAEPLPADVEKAATDLIAAIRSDAGRDPMVKASDVEGVGRREYYVMGAKAQLPHPGAEAVLQRYRKLALV